MSVRVTHTVDKLDREMRRVPGKVARRSAKVTKTSVEQGEAMLVRIAKKKAGPHGSNYYKRISSEMLSSYVGEFGPEGDVDNNAVGASWRNGPPNTDLAQTADVIGPRFAKNAGKILDNLL